MNENADSRPPRILLVTPEIRVTWIPTVLAAILFPVFAQAREAARKASSLERELAVCRRSHQEAERALAGVAEGSLEVHGQFGAVVEVALLRIQVGPVFLDRAAARGGQTCHRDRRRGSLPWDRGRL
mgnify:CR=1 FL=1